MAIEPEPRWLLVAPGVWVLLGPEHPGGACPALQPAGPVRLCDRLERGDRAAVRNQRARSIKVIVYTLGGLATGLAGVLQFVYLGAIGDPTTADGLELQVIAAVVIGGGSLSGGEGTVLGTLIGCLIMSVLQNGCVHADIPDPSQDIIIGIIIVAAVTLDRLRRRRQCLSSQPLGFSITREKALEFRRNTMCILLPSAGRAEPGVVAAVRRLIVERSTPKQSRVRPPSAVKPVHTFPGEEIQRRGGYHPRTASLARMARINRRFKLRLARLATARPTSSCAARQRRAVRNLLGIQFRHHAGLDGHAELLGAGVPGC